METGYYGSMECPFCGFISYDGEYAMLLHMESLHYESQPSEPVGEELGYGGGEEPEYVECPVEGCGAVVPLEEVENHVEMHAEYADPESGTPSRSDGAVAGPSRSGRPSPPAASSSSSSSSRRHSSRQQGAISAWKNILTMPSSSKRKGTEGEKRHSEKHHSDKHHGEKHRSEKHHDSDSSRSKRLGQSQLGKYADETVMPDWLVSLLVKSGQVVQPGIVPVLHQMLAQCSATRYAYLCNSCVSHVSKLKKEGGFCGYRNIQTIVSYVNAVQFPGHQQFQNQIPSVFQIQDLIESAWDAGINSQGRAETGGIRGTRKYIGTPEALAMFRLVGIPCDAQGFKDKDPAKAEALLMEDVENYFLSGATDPRESIRPTNMPPIYFQHAGHSMTIVGFEKQKNGTKNLIVFDPMFRDASSVIKLVGKTFEHRFPDLALKSYRRGTKYLKRFREFEILKLRIPVEEPSQP